VVTRWGLADQEGSIRDVAVAGSGLVDHVVYGSFGQVLSESDPASGMRMGYTAQVRDAETGLDYYNARYFDPAVGRFLSQDPIGFGGGDGNLYRYVGNDPLNNTDPTGWCADGMGDDWRMDLSQTVPIDAEPEQAKPLSKTFVRDPFSDNPNDGMWVEGLQEHWQKQADERKQIDALAQQARALGGAIDAEIARSQRIMEILREQWRCTRSCRPSRKRKCRPVATSWWSRLVLPRLAWHHRCWALWARPRGRF